MMLFVDNKGVRFALHLNIMRVIYVTVGSSFTVMVL